MFPVVLLCFIAVPIIEIYLLLQVGGVLGVLPTLLVVILTAVMGSWMLRQQGLSTLQRAQSEMHAGRMPAQEMTEGLLLMVGGVLLLTPGFATDAIGFICLFPVTRQLLVKSLKKRFAHSMHFSQQGASFHASSGGEYTESAQRHAPHHSTRSSDQGRVIEGEFERKD